MPNAESEAAVVQVEKAPMQPRSPEQEAATDAVILAAATAEWTKIAVLIARATDGMRAQSLEATPPIIALRIYALIGSGKLEVNGNMRRWRAAVVRLKA
jgi:Protein of unknown function